MTMHLVAPWVTSVSKKSKKQKWSSADKKKQFATLDKEWQAILNKYPPLKVAPSSKTFKSEAENIRQVPHIPSKPDSVLGPVCSKQIPKYTGTKIIGIGTMHKSNAVPIFSDDEAKEISRMRRG
jgi:hypothetical protein